jgi:hypothetical protein
MGSFIALCRRWRPIAPDGTTRFFRAFHSRNGAVMTVTLADISFLRQADRKKGTDAIPAAVAHRLMGARLIEREPNSLLMRTTVKGRIALTKLG